MFPEYTLPASIVLTFFFLIWLLIYSPREIWKLLIFQNNDDFGRILGNILSVFCVIHFLGFVNMVILLSGKLFLGFVSTVIFISDILLNNI